MSSPKPSSEPILRRMALGFWLILLLTWGTEIIHLPHLLFNEPAEFNWSRVLLRTAVILAIWLWVHLTTRRMLQRLHHLEGFLLICSWCRKVCHEGRWVTMEEFFGSRFSTGTSHGICPECAQKQLAQHLSITRASKSPFSP